MKTTLFYFTGTGNSLKIARGLAAALGDTEVVAIKSVMGQEAVTADSENVGIVFPVYMWGLPVIVKRFALRLNVKPDQYLFAVTNYGGWQGGTLLQMNKIFADRGMKMASGFGIKMPGNYTPMYGARTANAQQKLFDAAAKKVAYIAGQVKNRSTLIEKDFFLVKWLFWDVFYRFAAPHIKDMDKDFWADAARCTNCGTCTKVCPTGNITFADGKAQWNHKCEQCMACLQWCPKEAIQFGKNTADRKRYHQPEITVADIVK